ncbi:MAG: hypothetical protein KJ069_06275 [Anaerolineae bacterium]|nr:hypothetical protein [Anaerolineae bacterium]
MAYLYHSYVETLAKRFVANLSTVEAEHNFEFGPEFEIVLCKTLRSALPDRIGIARGYVVSQDSAIAGDDIVLFERSRFPTLMLRDHGDFARKEYIPAEATYCYIEAKHTLNLIGDDGQSLTYACNQVGKVKELLSKREKLPPSQIVPNFVLSHDMKVTTPENFPDHRNPAFTAIFAKQVRRKKGESEIADANQISSILKNTGMPASSHPPDIIVLGQNVIVFPKVPTGQGDGARVSSPFYVPDLSMYHISIVDSIAFGIGLIAIMWATDWIQLGVMPWSNIIADALRLPLTGTK